MSVGVLCWDSREELFITIGSVFFYRSSKCNSWKRKTQREGSKKGVLYDNRMTEYNAQRMVKLEWFLTEMVELTCQKGLKNLYFNNS
jgi:hypothetical protein